MSTIFVVLALGVVAVLTVAATRLALRSLAEPLAPGEGRLPTAPLQRLALTSLASALVPAVVALAVWIYAGADGYQERVGVRLLVYLLAGFAMIAGALPISIARRRAARGTLVLDERDEAVLRGAPAAQAWLLLVVIIGWSIGLTERYWDAGAIPVGWMAAMFWTSLIAWAVALPLGVTLGYRART